MKAAVVDLLVDLGLAMKRKGDLGRARAYFKAANAVARTPDLEAKARAGRLQDIRGVGFSIEKTIQRFLESGQRPEWLPPASPDERIAETALSPPPGWGAGPFADAPDLHCHTTWSDGALTLDELVALAKRHGARVLGISDHSGSLRIANGLDAAAVRAQWEDIARVQAAHPDVRLLQGTECDILRDGTLDHPPDILAGFDFVIGSLHSDLRAPLKQQTERVLTALADPRLTVLGHPTTRVPGRRPRANLDLDEVFAAAARHGVALEVNGNRGRIDLDEELARRALQAGARLALGSDTHVAAELFQFAEAQRIAQAAGATRNDIANYDLLKELPLPRV